MFEDWKIINHQQGDENSFELHQDREVRTRQFLAHIELQYAILLGGETEYNL